MRNSIHHAGSLELGSGEEIIPASTRQEPTAEQAMATRVSKTIDHAPIIDQFFGELVAGHIQGVRPQTALSSDVHACYVAWAMSKHLPITPSTATLIRYIRNNHRIKTARKRYADGGFIVGPRSVLFLAGPIYAEFGTESQKIGQQIRSFREQAAGFIRHVRGHVAAARDQVR